MTTKLTPEGAAAYAIWEDGQDWNAIASAAVEASEEVQRLKLAIECFCHEVEDAEAHFANKDKGGMQVPFRGDFCNVPPSTLSRLRWHKRNLRGER